MKLQRAIKKMQNGEPLTIAALGDSLTQGWMVRKGYLDFMVEMIREKYPHSNITMVNRGIPGDTAEGGLYRLEHDIIDTNPDLVLIQFGLNDAFMGVPPERFKNTVRNIVDRLEKDTDAEILLLTSVPIMNEREDLLAEQFYTMLSAVAEEKDMPIVLVHRFWKKRITEGADFMKLVLSDQVHPNIEGYRLMAEAVMEAL